MPTDPSNSPSPDQLLTPAERERRARVWTWSNRALLLIGGVSVVTLGATFFLSSLDANAVQRAVPAICAVGILYIALLLVLLILLDRNRPNRLTVLLGVRIILIGGYTLMFAMIGLLLTLLLWSLGIGVSTDVVELALIGFFVVVVAFVVMSIIAAFVALIEHGTRQQAEYRATHPRLS